MGASLAGAGGGNEAGRVISSLAATDERVGSIGEPGELSELDPEPLLSESSNLQVPFSR